MYKLAYTSYSCQVTPDEKTRLTKAAVVQQALALADAEGPEALTIRRLADQLGVTPMAIYWHFRNKDQLVTAVADHVMGEVAPDRDLDAPWQDQLRAMVEALVRVVRAHPSGPVLLAAADKTQVETFNRATEGCRRTRRPSACVRTGWSWRRCRSTGSRGWWSTRRACPTRRTWTGTTRSGWT